MRIFLMLALLLAPLAARAQTTPGGLEIVPIYLDDNGNGILRYEDPDGAAQQYDAALGMLTDYVPRPFEPFNLLGGPYSGPKVAICVDGLDKARVEEKGLVIQLYSNTENRAVAIYRPVFDASKAERIEREGKGAGPGECARRYYP